MPKKRTVAVARDRNGSGIELWSKGRKGPGQPLFNPANPESMAALQRTLNRVPEVMVKVTGGGRDTGTAQAHIDYIDRHGQLAVHTDDGEILTGMDVSKALVKDWKLDTIIHQRNRQAPLPGEKDKRAKLVHNIMLSMPRGTPPDAVLAAVQHFARENFALTHRYAMVLHDPATDPKHEKTGTGNNPHVHLVVKAVSETGKRLYIRRDTLQAWREQFASALREQGVQANATPAAIRGKAKSSAKGAIHQHQERLEKWRTGDQDIKKPVSSGLLENNVQQVLNELLNGSAPNLSGKTKLMATRDLVVKGWQATENLLREQGLIKTADQVVGFVKDMPPVKTSHELLKENMLADKVRLKMALSIQPPTVDKVLTRGDDLIR